MRSTYNIKAEKKIKLEKAAIELSVKLGRPIKFFTRYSMETQLVIIL